MKTKDRKIPHGSLKIWWIPQIPMKSFEVEVDNLVQAKLLLDVLADYDEFQFKNKIKPDYSNAGGLMIYSNDDKDWVDWTDEDGETIGKYTLEEIRNHFPKCGSIDF